MAFVTVGPASDSFMSCEAASVRQAQNTQLLGEDVSLSFIALSFYSHLSSWRGLAQPCRNTHEKSGVL